MKSVNDKTVIAAVITLFILFIVCKVNAQQYDYKGVYSVEPVMTNLCEDCFLQLPPEYLNLQIVLSVRTDDEQTLFKALQTSSRAIGWNLTRSKNGMLKAEPIENAGNLIYISCLDNQPHNVPKYIYNASVVADKRQCAIRDSLKNLERKKQTADSLKKDSLSKIKLDFRQYELRYFAYSKSFTDKLGLEWGSLISSGNFRGDLKFFDDWRLIATQTNDTTFNERSVVFSVDSTLSLDWGSEEQTLKRTFVNDGVTTSDYEWRKYGLIVNVRRDARRVTMQYIFRDKDNSTSVLQGSVIGLEGDTLRLTGHYNAVRTVTTGVPFLSSVPVIGQIFKNTEKILDNRAFELYLLPKQAVKDEKQTN